jgi:hypothetical protein
VAVSTDQFDRIPRSYLSLVNDFQIKAGASAGQKPLDDIVSPKFGRQLIAVKAPKAIRSYANLPRKWQMTRRLTI